MNIKMKEHFNYRPYALMMSVYIVFIAFALILDSPVEIYTGLKRIITSRSILVTDYIQLGGVGATLINSVFVGMFSILLMIRNKVNPNGAIIMGIWMNTGFAFFGKNIFNMWPITVGVWLFSRYQKEPFRNYALASLLCATLSPVVSELSFMGIPFGIFWGVLVGILVGFIFPSISSYTVRAHSGYCLYNMGFAGGLIATLIVCLMRSVGVQIQTNAMWSEQYTLELSIFMYLISALLIGAGIILSDRTTLKKDFLRILQQPGRLVTDFYVMYGECAFVNMGLLCAMGTTVMLFIGSSINGPTIGGIFTMAGFGAFGKHIRNVPPILIGAILSSHYNTLPPTAISNSLAILFSTGLAPIAGQYGWFWGIVTGFVHVNIATFVGSLNAGLNLYNNGFAAVFVAMLMVPIITAFRRDKNREI